MEGVKTKKVLFVSNLSNFSKFNLPFIKWFQEQGYNVHYASAGEEALPDGCCDKEYKLPIARSPWDARNFQACKQLKKIIHKEKYDIIHCHTPMGGVVARLSAKKAWKHGTKMIYTAHGFHFYKGAPLINWLLYYTMEKYLAHFTDCIVTINDEDYQTAVRKKFKAKMIRKIDGVGVDLHRFSPTNHENYTARRMELGYPEDAFVILYIAEFITRKNHMFIIDAIPEIKRRIPNAKFVFAGTGVLLEECKEKVELMGLADSVEFLGYRRDVQRLCHASDLLVSASIQEGLPIGIVEGMATGLPIVCAEIRGQTDIINDGENGFLYKLNDRAAFVERIQKLYDVPALREKMAKSNVEKAQKYSLEKAVKNMAEIYLNYM